jgi:hypothetical protein
MLNDKRQQLLSGGKKFSRSAFAVKDDSLVDLDFVLQPLASKISGDDLDLEVAKENLPDL